MSKRYSNDLLWKFYIGEGELDYYPEEFITAVYNSQEYIDFEKMIEDQLAKKYEVWNE